MPKKDDWKRTTSTAQVEQIGLKRLTAERLAFNQRLTYELPPEAEISGMHYVVPDRINPFFKLDAVVNRVNSVLDAIANETRNLNEIDDLSPEEKAQLEADLKKFFSEHFTKLLDEAAGKDVKLIDRLTVPQVAIKKLKILEQLSSKFIPRPLSKLEFMQALSEREINLK